MRKGCLIIICCLLICSFINVASGKTIYVDDSGGKDYTSIQDAIDNATVGDIIYVYTGTYQESIKINKTIELVGENPETTIINGLEEWATIRFSDNSNGSSLEGFMIKNSCPLDPTTGISIVSSSIQIYNNIIVDCGDGISITGDSAKIFQNVIKENSGEGISTGSRSEIFENDFLDNGEAILILFSVNNSIHNNNIENNSQGIELKGSYNTISDNEVKNNEEYGILVDYEYNIISNNTVEDNEKGIYVISFADFSQIFKNTISNNKYGIYLGKTYSGQSSNSNNISNNTFSNNNYDIYDVSNPPKKNGETPGFELIFVIIGIALVLLCKRRKMKL